MTQPPNTAQIDYWNDTPGLTWASLQTLLDRQIAPLGEAAMAALDPRAGERILDIGCGCGDTTLALALAVGPEGRVLGADISRPMLDVARQRIAASELSQASVIEADAQAEDFGAGQWDALYSRFGVMFFADPPAAFANLAAALKPGGRLAFVCWRPLKENPWMTAPLAAALKHVPPAEPTDPLAPGPFAFSDPERVRSILAGAGFGDVTLTPHDQPIGGNALEDALIVARKVGPAARLIADHPDKREAVLASLRETLAAHDGPDGVWFDSATWIVTAKRV
ncbi:methyltransferase domain-containing protein [Caulobacter sp. NIBR1757]|uniref:class I SAM-dependent methyltransferase n=1 Tax=Caulobacter sp. NIBR1757 TaxID=3016000 RepID=UPI0022EFE3FE|nr:methyltransferase domain-containing protein [Caulobacter sp. NIBR1757]WGM40780.1 2-methoxy-6-polyprenyl-1,4-benzoquinol methylase, mitochondrial [Caulobacter sp. NIBR1757]